MTSKKETWYKEGIRFQCTGSGKCCTSHGEFGFVFMTLADRKRMAQTLKMRTSDFTKKYCEKTQGHWHLIERKDNPDCLFLKGKGCTVYEGRPEQCRTWPFWPEVMNPKSWKKDVAAFCPGIGKGKLYTEEEINQILKQSTY